VKNYDDLHKLWSRAHAAGSPIKFTRNAVVYAALDRLSPGLTLDAGCGTGEYSIFLTNKGHKVTAFDPSSFAVRTLSENGGAALGIEAQTNTIDGFHSIEKFNNIVSIEVIEHIKQDQAAVRKLYSLLQERGTMIISTPARAFLYSEADRISGHYRRYSGSGFRKILINAGFSEVKIKNYGFPLLFIYLLMRKLFLSKIITRHFSKKETPDRGMSTILSELYPFMLAVDRINIPFLGIGYVAICRK